MIRTRRIVPMVCGALVASGLAAGCAGSKPAPQPSPAPVVDDGAARRQAEAAATAARETAERDARAAASLQAQEEAARAARHFEPLYFDYDSDHFGDREKEKLVEYARRLTEHADLVLNLEGHCDERGTTAYNLALGQKRADNVRAYLVRAGIAAQRLTTVSYGRERPADSRRNEAGWSLNRRVELVAGH